MRTVAIITDSLAMPRVEGADAIYIHETWPKVLVRKLDNTLFTLAEFTERARDTDSLRISKLYLEVIDFSNPEFLIFQIGIVDCAPRIISKKEHHFINRFFFPKKMRDFIIKRRKNRREIILQRGVLNKVYVNPIDFKKNYEFFIQKAKKQNPSIKVFLLPILGNYSLLQNKTKGYLDNINLYNSIINEIAIEQSSIYLSDLIEKMNKDVFYSSDGYHLNAIGHENIANEIYKHIIKIK